MRWALGILAGSCAVLSLSLVTSAQVPNGRATSLTVSTLTTGTSLQVSGTVSPDLRYVGVQADPMFSDLEGFDMLVLPGVAREGGTLRATSVRRVPFRIAQVGKVVFVDRDKQLLATRTPALELKSTSLKLAIRKVADVTRSNIVLGARGLGEAGVDVNASRDFNTPAATARETLIALLRVSAPETDMVITAEDRVIQIATRAQADNAVVTKSYYLEDLLANLPRFVPADTDLQAIGNKSTSKPLADSQPMDFSRPPANYASYDYSTRLAPAGRGSQGAVATPGKSRISTNIVDLITSTVRPEIWKVNGGKIGEIGVVGNHVTIRAPQSVHALLEGPSRYNPNKVSSYVGNQP